METKATVRNDLGNFVPNTTVTENNLENFPFNSTAIEKLGNSTLYPMYYDDSYNYYDYGSNMVDVFSITQYVLMPVCLLGILGNSGTLWVMSVPPFTHMPHCVLCRALAVVDLLKLTEQLIQGVLYSGWGLLLPGLSRATCKMHMFLILTLTQLDAWCITSLAIERLLAVCIPLKMKGLITKGRLRVLACLVVFFLLWNAELLFRFDLVWIEDFEFWTCMPVTNFGIRGFSGTKEGISEMLTTLIPICIMVPCNMAILLRLYQQHRKRQQLGANNTTNDKELTRMTIMICSITFAFIALMTPVSIYISIWGYGDVSVQNDIWFSVFYSLEILNTSLNFYAYIMTGKQFREKVFQLLGCCTSDSAGALPGNVGIRLGDVRNPGEQRSDEQRPKEHPDSDILDGNVGMKRQGNVPKPDEQRPKGDPGSDLLAGNVGMKRQGNVRKPDGQKPKGHLGSGLLAGNVGMKRQGNVPKPDKQRPKGDPGSEPQDDCGSEPICQSTDTTHSTGRKPVAPHD